MRILCVLFTLLCVSSVGYGQQLMRETIREYAPAPVQAAPTVVYRDVVRYAAPPVMYAAPVVYSAPVVFAPVYAIPAAVPMTTYRVGPFATTVIYPDGLRVRYRR